MKGGVLFERKNSNKNERGIATKKTSITGRNRGYKINKRRRLPTLPHCIAVPSAQVSLTSLFGMGRGGTSPQ